MGLGLGSVVRVRVRVRVRVSARPRAWQVSTILASGMRLTVATWTMVRVRVGLRARVRARVRVKVRVRVRSGMRSAVATWTSTPCSVASGPAALPSPAVPRYAVRRTYSSAPPGQAALRLRYVRRRRSVPRACGTATARCTCQHSPPPSPSPGSAYSGLPRLSVPPVREDAPPCHSLTTSLPLAYQAPGGLCEMVP